MTTNEILDDIGLEYDYCTECINNTDKSIKELEYKVARLVDDGRYINITRKYKIDNSFYKGELFQKNYGKNLLIGMNSVYNKIVKAKKIDYASSVGRLERAKNKYNSQAKLMGISINEEYFLMLTKLIMFKNNKKILIAEQKELVAKEKQRLREQEKLLEDIAREKERIAKERRYYEATIKDCDDAKREEIKSKLSELDKREQDVEYRENNQKSGWLYITSSSAMPNYTKIGVTRRYQPLIRLQELSSASVPYPFVCHGLVFSDDVFELEANVHKYFDMQRVNKSNRHKEFFTISPQEAIDVLTNEFNCDIIYVDNQ